MDKTVRLDSVIFTAPHEGVATGRNGTTDADGNVDPGLNCSPVPVRAEDLGMAIGRLPCPHCGATD